MNILTNHRAFYDYLLNVAWDTRAIRMMFENDTKWPALPDEPTRLDEMKYRFRFFRWARARYGIPG